MVDLPSHLKPWETGGFKAWDFVADGWPLDSTEINLWRYSGSALPEWLSRCTSVRMLDLRDCRSLTALPDLSGHTHLRELNLNGCNRLRALPKLPPQLPREQVRLPSRWHCSHLFQVVARLLSRLSLLGLCCCCGGRGGGGGQ